MSERRVVLVIVLAGIAARVALAALTGLGTDEAYSVGNARILSLSYIDHPPLHVWIAGLAMRLAGSEAALVVRLPFILLFAGSTWLIFRLGRLLYGERGGMWAAIWLNLAPVFSLAHAGGVLPDGPMIFFVLAAANAVAGVLFGATSRPALAWLLGGALAGLALLSKYNAVFFFLGVFAFLLTAPAQRRWLATPWPWLAFAVALLVFSPAIVWNLDHGLAGFGFQAGRAIAPTGNPLTNLLTDIAGQALYLSPWLFAPLVIVLARALRRGPSAEKDWFLGLLAIGPIGLFTLLSLWSLGQPHWSMPGWLFALALPPLIAERPRLLRRFAIASATIVAVVALGFGLQASGLGIAEARLKEWRANDPTADLVDWTDLPRALSERGLFNPDTVVAAPFWRIAGKASYALGPGVPVVCLCAEPHHFPYRADRRAAEGRDVILVSLAGARPNWRPSLASIFDEVVPLAPVAITRKGETVLVLDLALGKNLHSRAE